MGLMLLFRRISNTIDQVIGKVVFISIAGMILSITMQIVFRVFFSALTWTEELSRYLLIWSTFLGATMAYKRGMHIAVTFCISPLPQRIRKVIIILGIVLSIIFFAVAVQYGVKLMALQRVQVSPALQLPMRWIYLVIPFSFIIMSIYAFGGILEQLFEKGEVGQG